MQGSSSSEVGEDSEVSPSDDASSEAEKSRNGSDNEGIQKYAKKMSESSFFKDILASPAVKIHQGRPELDKLIKDEVALAKDVMSVNGGLISLGCVLRHFHAFITVCGTHGLVKAVREAIRYPRMMDILKGGPTISLHVEGFGGNVSKIIFNQRSSLTMFPSVIHPR